MKDLYFNSEKYFHSWVPTDIREAPGFLHGIPSSQTPGALVPPYTATNSSTTDDLLQNSDDQLPDLIVVDTDVRLCVYHGTYEHKNNLFTC